MASILLMTLDHREGVLDPLHRAASSAVYPLQQAVDLPLEAADGLATWFTSRQQLIQENRRLRERQLEQQAQLQRLETLRTEVERLRGLLGSSRELETEVTITEIMRVDLDPHTHLVEIDHGSRQGVFTGQPLLDANGVTGQVDQVGPFSATVRLITDPSHATPVEVDRNGVRSIAVGNGNLRRLELVHVPKNADIREGDLLTTSGLGGTFPRGYPVARVTSVATGSSEPFAEVTAAPTAELNRSRKLMLVSTERLRESSAHERRADDEEDGGTAETPANPPRSGGGAP